MSHREQALLTHLAGFINDALWSVPHFCCCQNRDLSLRAFCSLLLREMFPKVVLGASIATAASYVPAPGGSVLSHCNHQVESGTSLAPHPKGGLVATSPDGAFFMVFTAPYTFSFATSSYCLPLFRNHQTHPQM